MDRVGVSNTNAPGQTVSDVMTSRVHVATPSAPFKHLLRVIAENRISAIPIVNQQGF
ncbi:MAG: hypothetical protein QOI23_1654, partial [Chloroflexota bacterium]|nr:hypothetical protein [Chloroflexota bacterium]